MKDINLKLDTEIVQLRDDIFKVLTTDLSFEDLGNFFCKRIQAIIPNVYVSLCLIDNSKMIPWAAPDIDPQYSASYIGLEIGENVGNCGAAAYLKQPIIVENIETDFRWENYKYVAIPYGLNACYSYPVENNIGKIVATFAFYFKENINIETNTLLKIAEAGIEFCLLAIDKKNSKETIRNLKFFDQLTKLPNKNSLFYHLEKYAKNGNFIYMIDINNFINVNLLIGYLLGNKVLTILAERLKNKFNNNFFVSRLEEDIFIIVSKNPDIPDAETIAHNINLCIREEIKIEKHSLVLTASIGFTQYDILNSTLWLSECKSAVNVAKMKNANCYASFSKNISTAENEKSNLIQILRKTIRNNQLELAYQPQVDINNNSLYGLEALTRFFHPISKNYIPPSQFIPIIEEIGEMDNLSYWILEKVCNQLKIWDIKRIYIPKISVNLSASNLQNPYLSYYITSLLEKYTLSGSRLTLEITETSIISFSDYMIKNILEIKNLGIHLSIDDFGTGYSSLSNLINLPVNEIKIDKIFIEKMNEDPKFTALVSTIINLAKELKLNIVAEGIENERQFQLLKELNCNIIQGYYISKPISSDSIELWLKNR